MNMIRTFHPVGQGAFYTEWFRSDDEDDFVVVYDCGSDKNQSLVEQEIRNTFTQGQEIDAVFISHLHEDHVNGLEYLLTNYKVKNLILPLMDKVLSQIQAVANSLVNGNSNQFVTKLAKGPKGVQEAFADLPEEAHRPSVIFVKEIDVDSDDILYDSPDRENDQVNTQSVTYIQSGENIVKFLNVTELDKLGWVLLPFNFKSNKRVQLLEAEFRKRNLSFAIVKDFEDGWKDSCTRSLIIEAYNAVPGNLNTNTMTLYSGPDSNSSSGRIDHCMSQRCCHCRCGCMHCYPISHEAGCLYFGDYEASGGNKWKKLDKCYHSYWGKINCVQIPHHGSKLDYNSSINQKAGHCIFSVISAGMNNRYGHPDSSTLIEILNNCGIPLVVDERSTSKVVFHIV